MASDAQDDCFSRVQSLLKLATGHMHDGNLSEAETEFKRALEVYPNELQAHYGLGLCYFARNDLDRARTHLTLSLGHAQISSTAHLMLGEFEERDRRYKRAALHYEVAILRDESNKRAADHLIAIQGKLPEDQKPSLATKPSLSSSQSLREFDLPSDVREYEDRLTRRNVATIKAQWKALPRSIAALPWYAKMFYAVFFTVFILIFLSMLANCAKML